MAWPAPSLSAVLAGIVSAVVGFTSSFAIVLAGLTQMGASAAQAASGLMAAAVAMGLGGIAVSLLRREPVSMAWSTPGAALLAASAAPAGGFAEAVGAFLAAGAMVLVASAWSPVGRTIAAIPGHIAQAMLAGILLPLCLVPVRAVAEIPALGLPIVATWLAVGQIHRLAAVPAAVAVAAGLVAWQTDLSALDGAPALWPAPVLVVPEASLAAMIGIALPLFFVTMASQNIPGIAVLRGCGYAPPPGPLFAWTGAFSLAAAPFGGHMVNLAAITAALCANRDVHPDPARRYWAAVVAGLVYVAFGLAAGLAVAFASLAPPLAIGAVAGLALIATLASALAAALADPDGREAAVLTLVVAASGVSIAGVSGAFWGLAAGLALDGARGLRRRNKEPRP